MIRGVGWFFMVVVWLAASPVWAGGSGLNVVVVVNQNSPNSRQLGNDYCQWRGVPPQNLLRLTNWAGGSVEWSPGEFTNELLNPLLAMIASRGLTNQAEWVLLSMDLPYRVTDGTNENSTTSDLFYGFKAVGAEGSCALPDESTNGYAHAELPFSQGKPNTASGSSFLAMMLTDSTLAGAESLLSRGVASDGSAPTQTVWLAKTDDELRNVRFVEFDNAVFENQVSGNAAVARQDTDATGFTNLGGLETGLGNFPLATNEFVPGAIGDDLTSFGGFIFDMDGRNQTPLLAFLEAGAAGSYGTVTEPCNYTEKFPDPVDSFYQARGFALAEAYYQSVMNPFQGLVVGEPLAAPFARPGAGDWSSLTNGAVLAGQVTMSPAFTAAGTNLPLTQADLFVDGTFLATMTNLPPAAGNVLSVTLNGDTVTQTVQANDTPATVAAGLAGALNRQTPVTQVMATAAGDRIELQSLAMTVPGSNVTVSVSAAIGSAPALTTGLRAARPVFLDPVATGYLYVGMENAPIPGDWLQLNLVKTNGVTVTVGVTNTTGSATVGDLMLTLVNLINSTPALESADGVVAADYLDLDPDGAAAAQFYLKARTAGWPASQIGATLTTSTNLEGLPTGAQWLEDNLGDLRARDHLYVSSGLNSLAVRYAWDTTQLPDGWHQLTAVACEGTSVRTQTRVTRTVQIQNTSLTATLTAWPGTNGTLNLRVAANATNIARIELFSTGGSVGVVTNQAAAVFPVSVTNLGVGRHPFQALVTDPAGHRYQTATVTQFFPLLTLTLTGVPPTLAWPAALGHSYDVQGATNLAAGFATVATITATNNGEIEWPVAPTGGMRFYRVQLDR